MPSSTKRILDEGTPLFGKHEPVDIQVPEEQESEDVGQLSASFGGKVPDEKSKSRILATLNSLSGGAVGKEEPKKVPEEDDLELAQAVPMV